MSDPTDTMKAEERTDQPDRVVPARGHRRQPAKSFVKKEGQIANQFVLELRDEARAHNDSHFEADASIPSKEQPLLHSAASQGDNRSEGDESDEEDRPNPANVIRKPGHTIAPSFDTSLGLHSQRGDVSSRIQGSPVVEEPSESPEDAEDQADGSGSDAKSSSK